MPLLLIIFAILFFPKHLFSEDIIWNGKAGDSLWGNAMNWDKEKVPGKNDNAIIGDPTAVIQMPEGYIRISSIQNLGTLKFKFSIMLLGIALNNQNKITIDSMLFIFPDFSPINNIVRIDNYGIISGPSGDLKICAKSKSEEQLNFNNSGNITTKSFEFIGNSFLNKENGKIISGTLEINSDEITNSSDIEANKGNIWLTSKYLKNINKGKIISDYSDTSAWCYLSIIADEVYNNESTIRIGSNCRGGDIAVFSKKFNNINGTIKTFDYDIQLTDYQRQIWIFSDTINISGDSTINAYNLAIMGINISFSNLKSKSIRGNNYLKIVNNKTGLIDLSKVNVKSAFFSNDSIEFFSDKIILPPEGLDFICEKAFKLYSADTTFIDSRLSNRSAYDLAGSNHSLELRLLNTSSIATRFYFYIESKNSWITYLKDSTIEMEPYSSVLIPVEYKIPFNSKFLDSDYFDITISKINKKRQLVYVTQISGRITSIGVIDNKTRVEPEQVDLDFELNHIRNNEYEIELNSDITDKITCNVYDLQGRKISKVIDAFIEAGRNKITLDFNSYQPGVYIIRIIVGVKIYNKKVIVF